MLLTGAERLGASREDVEVLISIARGDEALEMPNPGGVLVGKQGLPDKVDPDLNFVLAYDPAITLSYSTGWVGKQQENCARWDARDLFSFMGEAWWRRNVPYVWQLPTRLALNLLMGDVTADDGRGNWLRAIAGYGMVSSEEAFISISKDLSTIAKNRGSDKLDRLWFTETAGLVGCRYPGPEAEDEVSDEIRSIADKEVLLTEACAKEYLRVADKNAFRPQATVPLEQYVEDCEWSTPGGASMTGLEPISGTVSGTTEVVLRLAKNLIIYVTGVAATLSAVLSSGGITIVNAMIKLGETQKNRVIYPYALYQTISKMWLLSFAATDDNYPIGNHVNMRRPWKTSYGLTGWGEILRHFNTLSLVSRSSANYVYLAGKAIFDLMEVELGKGPRVEDLTRLDDFSAVMAMDVDAFDKQVGAFFADEFWGKVRRCVPPDDWKKLTASTETRRTAGLQYDNIPYVEYILPPDRKHAYLLIPGRKVFEYLGQMWALAARTVGLVLNLALLTSGTPETSKAGNRASYLVAQVGAEILDVIVPGSVEMFEVRGDDQLSSVRGKTQRIALALALLWWVISNAFLKMAPAKSRISVGTSQSTEFLRIDYSAAGAVGYMFRALVWYCERRPLSTEERFVWASKVVPMVERAYTVRRRYGSRLVVEFAFHCVAKAFARLGINADYLSIPSGAGGMGIGPPVCGSARVTKLSSVRADADLGWAKKTVVRELEEYNVTDNEATIIAQARADDAMLQSQDKAVNDAVFLGLPIVTRLPVPALVHKTLPQIRDALSAAAASSFGSCPRLAVAVAKASQVARVRGVSVMELLPASEVDLIRQVEKRYKLPRSLAIDWLSGVVPGNIDAAHPQLRFIAMRCAAGALHTFKGSWDSHTSYFAFAHALHHYSMLTQGALGALFSW